MGYRKNFYLNDYMDTIFCGVRKELADKQGRPVEDVSAAETFREIFERANEHSTTCKSKKTFHEVSEFDLTRPETIIQAIELATKKIDNMTPSEAEKALRAVVKLGKERTRNINAKALYGPNSYHHLLKEMFVYKEPPLPAIWNILQHQFKMMLAARAQGRSVSFINALLEYEHLMSGKADMNDPDPLDARHAKAMRGIGGDFFSLK